MMTTASSIQTNGRNPSRDTTLCSPGLERQAIRFLLGHRLGRLMTIDPITHEPLVSPVHYVLDSDGALVTHLPADSEHVAAIRRGGVSLLSVYPPHAGGPGQFRDADGELTAHAVRQVQAELSIEVIDDPDRVADVLRRQISSVLQTIGQQSESDAAARAPRTALNKLVVVRMHIEDLCVRLRRDAAATA